MRLLYVLERWPELSQTFVAEEINALQASGAIVEVVCLAHGQGPTSTTTSLSSGETGPLRRLSAALRQAAASPRESLRQVTTESAWPPPGGTARLRGMLRLAPFRAAALRCDHIHAHFATEAADMARLLAASTGRPWSFTAHASDAYSHPDRLAVNLKSAKFARAASPHVATQLRKASPDSQIVEIPVAVALDRFERTTPYLATGPIVSTGRLVEKKGFDDLINAFATARLDDRELWIIGEGPLRPDLEGRAEGLNVRFLGALDPDSVSDALRDASAFALLSKVASDGDRDGRPVAIVEAMAAGLPIISTRLPGIEDLVDRGCGLLVEPANAVSAAVAIRELMHMDPEQRGAMGRHGQLRTKAFAPELVAARLRALFAE